jgi:uncharacterized protein YegP (UPF0339 family)
LRYEINYVKPAPEQKGLAVQFQWRLVDALGRTLCASPHYPSKADLLRDLQAVRQNSGTAGQLDMPP